MMKNRNKFIVGWFTLMVTIVLVLPGTAFAELSSTWLVNSTAPAMGCNYSGTANLTQNDSSIDGSITLTLAGDGCPSPINLSLHFTPPGPVPVTVRVVTPTIPDFSGIWSVNSTAPIMGCNYSGTANIIQNDASLKALVTLTFTGNGCPSEITWPIFFTLSSPS